MKGERIGAVGVIGLGMGWEHARAWRRLGVRVAAVCDPNADRAAACARETGARVAPDWPTLLADPAIRAVTIATPDHLHFAHAAAALRAGKHVMLEKPMVTNLAQARALVRLVRQTRRQLAVGNVNRFVPQFAHAAALAHRGRLGKLFHVEADYIHDMRGMYAWTPWRLDRRHPQDFWFGGGVHPVDLIRWLGGEIVAVHARATRGSIPEFPLPSDWLATFTFASGATGKVWCTAGIRRRPEHYVRLAAYGDKGSIEADLDPVAREHLHPRDDRRKDWRYLKFRVTRGHPVKDELAHFKRCLETGRRPLVDVVDGARTIAVLEAGRRSARLGRTVRVPAIN